MLNQLLKTVEVLSHARSGLPKVYHLVNEVDSMKRREVLLL